MSGPDGMIPKTADSSQLSRSAWVLRLVLGVVALAAVVYALDVRSLTQLLARIDPAAFALAICLVAAMFLVMAVRWYCLVGKIAPLGFAPHLRCYLTANLLNLFTPANLGGDAYRLIRLRVPASAFAPLLVALVRERLIGIVGFAAFYLACFSWQSAANVPAFDSRQIEFSVMAVTLACGLLILWVARQVPLLGIRLPFVRRRPKLAAFVDHVLQALRFGGKRRFALLLALSIVGCLLWTAALVVVAGQFDVAVSVASLGMIASFVEFVRAVPVTVQGIGVREGAVAYGFLLLGLPPEEGFLVGAIAYVAVTVAILLGGLFAPLLPESSVSEAEGVRR